MQSRRDIGNSEAKTEHTHVAPDAERAQHQRRYGTAQILGLLVVLSALSVFAVWAIVNSNSAKNDKKNIRDRPVPVVVATAKQDSLPIEIRTIGNVLPYSVVNVTPQVGGQLQKVFFTQGDFVRKGDLLFQIDPRPYQASVEQSKGNVEKDQAQVEVAKSNLQRDTASIGQMEANLKKDLAQLEYAKHEQTRYNSLFQQGAVSQEQGEQMATNASAAQATIQADRKAIENARAVTKSDQGQIGAAIGTLNADQATERTADINLGWTQIRSPIDGRTGSLQVYEGNVVAANSTTPIVTIDQVQPIYIQFTLPEQYLDEIRRSLAQHTLKVQAMVEGQKTDSVEGTVSFLESSVNTTSGTVALRATFVNQTRRLFPGQFVDVLVTMPPPSSSIVVPAAAVNVSQKGNAVFVVKPDNTVAFVPVQMDRAVGDMAAISQGLNPGDQVVIDGQLQLTPGSKVKIVSSPGSVPSNDSVEGIPGIGAGDNGGNTSADNGTPATGAGNPNEGAPGGSQQNQEKAGGWGGRGGGAAHGGHRHKHQQPGDAATAPDQ